MYVDAEALSENPHAAALVKLVQEWLSLFWMGDVGERAMRSIISEIRHAWAGAWDFGDQPALVIERTRTGRKGIPPRRPRRTTNIMTCALWRQMNKDEKRRWKRQERKNGR